MNQENFLEPSANPHLQDCPGLRAMIIGVGGAGTSLVDGLRFDNFDYVENLVIDVDVRSLADSLAAEKLTFGRRHTRGMGTGGDVKLPPKVLTNSYCTAFGAW